MFKSETYIWPRKCITLITVYPLKQFYEWKDLVSNYILVKSISKLRLKTGVLCWLETYYRIYWIRFFISKNFISYMFVIRWSSTTSLYRNAPFVILIRRVLCKSKWENIELIVNFDKALRWHCNHRFSCNMRRKWNALCSLCIDNVNYNKSSWAGYYRYHILVIAYVFKW